MDEVVGSVSRQDAAQIAADFNGHKGIETIRRCRVGMVLDGCKMTDVKSIHEHHIHPFLLMS